MINIKEIKDLMVRSLDNDSDADEFSGRLEAEGISINFSHNFGDKVLNKLVSTGLIVSRETESLKYMNLVFSRIAFTGIAAIIILLISIFLKEGSFSFNSFLGLSDNYNESIVCLLTGN